MSICSECENDTCVTCEHAVPGTCTECERDEGKILLGGDCFFCLCEGKAEATFDYKPREVLSLSLEAVRLGKARKRLHLSAPILRCNRYEEFYQLFMEGYTD